MSVKELLEDAARLPLEGKVLLVGALGAVGVIVWMNRSSGSSGGASPSASVPGAVPTSLGGAGGSFTGGGDTSGGSGGGSSGPTGFIGSIRAAGALPYDTTHSGIPLRSGPFGSILSEIPFGANVTVTGPAINGPSNFGTSGGGSQLWYPVSFNGQTGYISAYDLMSSGPGSTTASSTYKVATGRVGM